MKKMLLLCGMILAGSMLVAQPCADPANIYTFSYGGKSYEVIREKKDWANAAACAVERGGYLVHIGSQAENDAIYDAIVNGAGVPANYTVVPDGGGVAYVWIGATDQLTEGTWLWDGDSNGNGDNFWMGQGAAGAGGGYAVGGSFYAWGCYTSGTPNEPDNFSGNQHAGAIALAGWPAGSGSLGKVSEWNDIRLSNLLYFVVEIDNTGMTEPGRGTLNFFPNPVREVLNLSLASGLHMKRVEITTPDGRRLLARNLDPVSELALRLPPASTGVCLITVTLEDGSRLVKRIMISE